jgi:DNA modification methylase
LRDYGHTGQIGLEDDPYAYIDALVEVFRCVKDVLEDDGTLWLNIGDSYAANRSYQVPSTKGGKKHSETQAAGGKGSKVPDGMKAKDLIGIPWTLALALRADGWFLRQEIIWHSPNTMPERVTDRCVSSHEHIFLLSKKQKYYFDFEAIQEDAADGGKRRKRDVWSVNSARYKGAHGAVFPPKLIEPCVLAGSKPGGIVLDPFMGSGTTAEVAVRNGRNYIGCELNPDYKTLMDARVAEANAYLISTNQ